MFIILRVKPPSAVPATKARSQPHPDGLRTVPVLWPAVGLALLTLAMFSDVLFQSQRVLSTPSEDLASQFVYWRDFGFSHLRHGELPLWNPHIFGGAPFFGGFQSALLYPPNVLFLFLPLAVAINWSIALHVFLAGAFAFLWMRTHVARWQSAFLGAAMTMFGGAYFLHISAGHLSNLCTMVWAPLVFLAIEQIADGPTLRRCLFAVFVATMMVLAGHPQYLFYTAIASALYVACLAIQRRINLRSLVALAAVCIAAILITAVQLLTGLQEATEGVRSIPLSYDFASMFPFPPENLLTAFSPWFFGNLQSFPYWGRCYIFEMSVFASVTGLVLGVYGAIGTRSKIRIAALIGCAVLVLLALGAHTPLFKALYDYVPGFNKFRGISKFIFLVTLWWALLAALGFDKLLNNHAVPRVMMIGTAVCAVLLGATALSLRAESSSGNWQKIVIAMYQTGETTDDRVQPEQYDAAFNAQSRRQAATGLAIAATMLLTISGILLARRVSTRSTSALLVLATVELFIFGRSSIVTFDLSTTEPAVTRKVLAENPGDYRVLNTINPNSAMISGAADIWGYDPSPILRYVQFVAATEGVAPDKVTQDYPLKRDQPALALLRLRYLFARQNGEDLVGETKTYLPHLLLVGRARVLTNRMDILATVTNANFTGRDEVILESPPHPAPEPVSETTTNIRTEPRASASGYSVNLIDSTTDTLTIEATVAKPAILLVTDAYSRFWTVHSLQSSPQQNYEILPADYCLRAIPLAAGHHLVKMEYRPPAFTIGKWISIVSVLIYLVFLGWSVVPTKRQS